MPGKSRPVKIAVIGTLCWDKIICPDQGVFESFGGIAYTVLTLASLLESKAEIIPVCNVGKDRFEEAVNLFKKNPGLNLAGLAPVEQKNNSVKLTYYDTQNREEILEGRVPSLKFEQVQLFLSSDYFLVNFISGWDLEYEALANLKKNTQAKIYIDLHSLTLGIDQGGKRFRRKPERWEEIAACADYLQLNQPELETILGSKVNPEGIRTASRKLMELGPEIVIITLSERGCQLTYRTKENETKSKEIESKPASPVADTTGCGDVFGAGFLAKLIATRDPLQAADFANYVAGLKAAFPGFEGMRYFTALDLELA